MIYSRTTFTPIRIKCQLYYQLANCLTALFSARHFHQASVLRTIVVAVVVIIVIVVASVVVVADVKLAGNFPRISVAVLFVDVVILFAFDPVWRRRGGAFILETNFLGYDVHGKRALLAPPGSGPNFAEEKGEELG